MKKLLSFLLLALYSSFLLPSAFRNTDKATREQKLNMCGQHSWHAATAPLKVKTAANPVGAALQLRDAVPELPTPQSGRNKLIEKIMQKIDLEEKKPLYQIQGAFAFADFSPDSQLLLSTSSFKTEIRDSKTGAIKHTLGRQGSAETSWSPDSRMVRALIFDFAKVWDAQTGAEEVSFYMGNLPNTVEGLAWGPNSKLLATSSRDNDIYVWDIQKGAKKHTLAHSGDVSTKMLWSPDENLILTIDRFHIYLWNAQTGALQKKLCDSDLFSWSPDSKLVLLGQNRSALVWDIQTGATRLTLNHLIDVSNAKWSPDSKLIFTVQINNIVHIWDAQTGEKKHTFPFKDTTEVAWSPDSQFILTSEPLGATIWDVHTGKKRSFLHHTHEQPLDVRWSSDPRFVLTRSLDFQARGGIIKVWDLDHLQDIKKFKAGQLNPAQYTLVELLDKYSEKAQAYYAQLEKERREKTSIEKPNNESTRHILRKVIELAHTEMPHFSLKNAIEALMMFNATFRAAIMKTYGIHEDEIAVELAKEQLFEGAHPFLTGELAKEAIEEHTLGIDIEKQAKEAALKKVQEEKMKTEKELLDKIELAQKWEQEKEVVRATLFAAIKLANLADVKKHLNPVTVLASSPETLRTALMEVIWHSKSGETDYDKIFDEILTFNGDYFREGRDKAETRKPNLAAQDFGRNTPLILAIKQKRFDYALKIAQRMQEDGQWHAAFKLRDSEQKSAYDLVSYVKKHMANNNKVDNNLDQLLVILEKYGKEDAPGAAK